MGARFRFDFDALAIATASFSRGNSVCQVDVHHCNRNGIHPEQTEGLLDVEWGRSKFDFYTARGAEKLGQFLKTWQGGKLVLSIAEMPIKCPVAPLEFLFLADSYFSERGMRDKVDIHLVTPLSGAFTKPTSSRVLGEFLERKGISVTPDFGLARVDSAEKKLIAWDDSEVNYDLLVSIPLTWAIHV